jgi:hypothetical protein
MGRLIGIVFICFALLFTGCAPAEFKPVEPTKYEFDKTPEYKAGLDEIVVPDKPVKILLTPEFAVTDDPSKAKYVAFAPKEYAKVQAHLKVRQTYKEIAGEQEKLVNTYIEQINALKELLALEQKKAQAYYELWVNSENSYRQEKYARQIDNLYNRSVIGVMSIGVLLIAILAL